MSDPAACLNLAAYRFVDLDRLTERRADIDTAGRRHGLKGTVLLAPEGINLFVSGAADSARAWLDSVREDPAFADLDVKESWSDSIAFDRWKVRIRDQIITLRLHGAPASEESPPARRAPRPQAQRAPVVSAEQLERWLDARQDDNGRPVVIVDTRNAFEVQAGRFEQAVDLDLHSFSDFPEAIDAQRDRLAGHRIVTYCTGGIRCEKAALWMLENGFDDVVQLDGGVLRYFEHTGARHWHGDLFVFDKRVTIDPALRPSSTPTPDVDATESA